MPFWPSGMKRTRSPERSSSADPPLTAPTLLQLRPPSTEYCHAPLPSAVAVIAMPCTAPVSTSLIDAPMKEATVWPLFAVWSSVIELSDGVAAASTGASLTAETAIVAVSVAVLKAADPPLVLVSALLPAAPLVWSQAR